MFCRNATIIAIAIVAVASAPSAIALLFSPLLLKAIPWGVAGRRAVATPRPNAINSTPHLSQPVDPSVRPDFGHDDDLMRCKHELLSNVYTKSLNRCFVSREGTCSFIGVN